MDTLAQEGFMDPFGFGEGPLSSVMQPFRRSRTRAYNPMCDVDVIEKNDGSFQVQVDMPGVDPKGKQHA